MTNGYEPTMRTPARCRKQRLIRRAPAARQARRRAVSATGQGSAGNLRCPRKREDGLAFIRRIAECHATHTPEFGEQRTGATRRLLPARHTRAQRVVVAAARGQNRNVRRRSKPRETFTRQSVCCAAVFERTAARPVYVASSPPTVDAPFAPHVLPAPSANRARHRQHQRR